MKSFQTILILLIFGLFLGCNGQETSKNLTQLDNETDSVSYSIGMNIAENMKAQGISDLNIEALSQAFKDVFSNNTTLIDQEGAMNVLNTYFQNQQQSQYEENIREGEEFLAENKTREGVITLPSGLQYEVLVEGKGEKPALTDKVKTHYHGTLLDGTVFDSSVDRGEPISFPVNGVIAGWTEALQLMPVGSKWKLYIPSELAYGERGAGQAIGPYSTLIFEVELISIEK